MKKPRVTIGIPAYNAEDNIKPLLSALLRQIKSEQGREIIVYSDCSRDKTVARARKIKSDKIRVIEAKRRGGFSLGVKTIFEIFKTDILVLLNDDIKITDEHFIEKLIKPFQGNPRVGLVSGNPRPLKARNFIEEAIISSVNAYKKASYKIKNGDNNFTCDGKILGLSKAFAKSLTFPKDMAAMGNVDAYLYFSCLANGFRYINSKEAIAYYRCPSSFGDYLSLTIRNNSNFYLLRKTFGKLVDKEYEKPIFIFTWSLLTEFIKNPLGCLFIFLMRFYINLKAKMAANQFNKTWEVVRTSKVLDYD